MFCHNISFGFLWVNGFRGGSHICREAISVGSLFLSSRLIAMLYSMPHWHSWQIHCLVRLNCNLHWQMFLQRDVSIVVQVLGSGRLWCAGDRCSAASGFSPVILSFEPNPPEEGASTRSRTHLPPKIVQEVTGTAADCSLSLALARQISLIRNPPKTLDLLLPLKIISIHFGRNHRLDF